MTYYPPDAIAWHCNICDTPVDVAARIDHLASPLHGRCAETHPLGGLEEEAIGRYIFGKMDGGRGGGGVSVGGYGGEEGKGKGKQVSVEEVDDYEDGYRRRDAELVEDEHDDDSDDDDDEEEGDSDESEESEESENEYEEGEYEEGEEGAGGTRMRWTCDICAITINVFARDEHLRSRAHLREARSRPTTPPPSAPTWHCSVCDEEMTVFHQAEHVASKQHLKLLRNPAGEEDTRPVAFSTPGPHHDFPISAATAKSTAFQYRNTFYCITCAAEFDLSTQDLHLATTNTWDCAVCPAKMHLVSRDQHLRSDQHRIAAAHRLNLFYCTVCQRSVELASRSEHLAGASHPPTSSARMPGTETRGVPTATRTSEPSASIKPRPTIPVTCYVCKEPLYCELLSSHLLWHCSGSASPMAAGPSRGAPPGSHSTTPTAAPRPSTTASPENHSTTPTAAAAPPKPKTRTKGKKSKGNKTGGAPEGSVYCYICHRHLEATGFAAHRASSEHLKKAAKLAAKKAAKKATATATGSATGSSATTPQSKSKLQLKHKYIAMKAASAPYITTSGENFHCQVCGRNRKVAGMDGHITSQKHKKNLAAALPAAPGNAPATSAPAATAEEKEYCTACKKYKLPLAMKQHCKSKKHKRNVLAAANPIVQAPAQIPTVRDEAPMSVPKPGSQASFFYCGACQTNVPAKLMGSHMIGREHVDSTMRV